MFYKDRVREGFRSLYAQRPAQRSVLRRTFFFNAEVAIYAYKSLIASHNYRNLVQEGIDERIPGFSTQSGNTSPATYPTRLHYIYRGRMWAIFDLTVNVLFYSLLRRILFRSAKGNRCLVYGIS